MAARDLEWRPAPAPGPPSLYLRESSSLTAGPREEGPGRGLASPGSRILARATTTSSAATAEQGELPVITHKEHSYLVMEYGKEEKLLKAPNSTVAVQQSQPAN